MGEPVAKSETRPSTWPMRRRSILIVMAAIVGGERPL
jgi:hypothetical protein